MTRLRSEPTFEARAVVEQLQHERRQRELVERRLDRLEQDRADMLHTARAVRRAISHLPASEYRDELEQRVLALGIQLEPFTALDRTVGLTD